MCHSVIGTTKPFWTKCIGDMKKSEIFRTLAQTNDLTIRRTTHIPAFMGSPISGGLARVSEDVILET